MGIWLAVALPGAAADEPAFGEAADESPPRVIKDVMPYYPMGMLRAGLEARVVVRFVVNKEGRVVNPYVHSSNNPWFDRPALDAVEEWRFEPGRKGGKLVSVNMQLPIIFTLDEPGRSKGFWTVTRGKWDDSVSPEYRWDTAPEPVGTAFPIYPLAALRAGINGKTKVRFVVGPAGSVVASKVLEATTPEFGAAVLAMIETWKFNPAQKKDGTPCLAMLSIEHEFLHTGRGEVPVVPAAREIIRFLEKNPDRIHALGDLDAMPKPVSRRPPVYPTALLAARVQGTATIEFFIDEAGDAQLPDVISATQPEFGHAAAQAVATWRFTPPKVNGKSVIARVRIPVAFKVPDATDGKKPETGSPR